MRKLLLYPLEGQIKKRDFDFLFFNKQLPIIVLQEEKPSVMAHKVISCIKNFFGALVSRGLAYEWSLVENEGEAVEDGLTRQLEEKSLPIIIYVRVIYSFKGGEELVISLCLNEPGEKITMEKDEWEQFIKDIQEFWALKRKEVNEVFSLKGG